MDSNLRMGDEINSPIISDTFAGLYQKAISKVFYEPHFVTAPRGQKIKEVVNQALVLTDPTSNLFAGPARSVDLRYLAGELIWYFMGENHIDGIAKYSTFWDQLKNAKGELNSAYGNLLFTEKNDYGHKQWEWALNSLINDKDTRQAIMHFNKPHHQEPGTKDFVCTIYGMFMIREDALNFHVYMRSNDIWFGVTYDIPFFSLLMQVMRIHLLPTYPNLKIGSLYHNATSLHIYERNFKMIEKMFAGDLLPASLPLIAETPIDIYCNPAPEIIEIRHQEYQGSDEFFNWLQENSK